MEEVPIWPAWRRSLFRFTFLYVGLLLLTFPVDLLSFPCPGRLLAPLTTVLAQWMAAVVWRITPPYLLEIGHDTTLLYVHLGNVLVVAGLGALMWGWLDRQRRAYPRLLYLLRTVTRYFLAAILLSYGCTKVFKTQFYLPEPNILYTPLGELPRDLLYWSTMGTSRGYSAFAGAVEILVGLLLCWRRTSLVGALLGMGVMANVLALNLGFDITVKVFAGTLCLLCGVVVAPDAPRLLDALLGRGVQASTLWSPRWKAGLQRGLYGTCKALAICLLLLNALGPYFATGHFNDDRVPRPRFHGAYAVEEFVQNGDTLPADLRQGSRWRRAFVHRKSFFILQTMDDRLRDFPLEWDSLGRRITFLDPATADFGQFHYRSQGDSLLHLEGVMNQDSLRVVLHRLDWRALPALRGAFHWTSDAL